MPQSTLTYVLSYIRQNVPPEILQLAFKPRKYNTTIEQRIISEIIEGPILQDTNLLGGKRRDIIISPSWQLDVRYESSWNIAGTGVQGSYYKIPEEAREYRNISSVIGVSPTLAGSLPGTSSNSNGTGSFGNTANGMLSQMLNTRTFAQDMMMPQITLEGTNIIRFNPEQLIDVYSVTVFLENDSEFLNLNPSAIVSLRALCLCAVKRYISTTLRVSIDETEVVAGMEIGVVKDLIVEYGQKAEEYDALLVRVKGSMSADNRSLSRLIYHAL